MAKELNMEQLTIKWCNDASGQKVDQVIGAGLNVVMSALNALPNKDLISGAAMSLRSMADQLDVMASDVRQ